MVIDMMETNTVVVVVVVAKDKIKFRLKINDRYLHLDVF